ncbi:caprin-2 isoform X2 [Pseudophryne corroboree]|uniref:caprin-2 isoform X2 n=1 Tax=Pseudophryne corroboree TaxID=495146 RepID=UPI0030813126
MVQLSPSSPNGGVQRSPVPPGQGSLPTSLSSVAAPLQMYETYLENGYISLKHKIRNIEKKKAKLDDYRDRLNNGEALNQDQLEAVEKYDEVLHNLEFAKELQKTFSSLNQELIKAQKKAQRRDQVLKVEAEKKRLCTILQTQYLLQSFCQGHVRKDFKSGLNGAIYLSPKELDNVSKFADLLCHKRFKHISLEEEMGQLSVYLWNLLEGNEKTVAGTNYKSLKDLVARMLDCGYFESVPEPPPEKKPEPKPVEPPQIDTIKVTKVTKSEPEREQESYVEYVKTDTQHRGISVRYCLPKNDQMVKAPEVQKPGEVKSIRPEPIKAWPVTATVKLQETKRWLPTPSVTLLTKPWEAQSAPQPAPPQPKGFVLEPPRERRERGPRLQPEIKPVAQTKDPKVLPVENGQAPVKKTDIPVAISANHCSPSSTNVQPQRMQSQPATEFCYSPTLPKDPQLRKQRLEALIDEIKGTYNFMQDSLLDFQFPSPVPASTKPPPEPAPEVPADTTDKQVPIVQAEKVSLSPVSMEPKSEPLSLSMEPKSAPLSPAISEPAAPPATTPSPVNHPVALTNEVEKLPTEQKYTAESELTEPQLERNKTPVPLPSPQLQSPKTPTNTSLLQLQREGTPLLARSPPVSSHSSPFPGMQAIFKVNAPLPLRKESEIREELLYPLDYQQTFSTASTQTAPHGYLDGNGGDQQVLPQETFISPSVSNGSMPCYTSSPNLVPRMPQQCLTTRSGTIRGTSRGGRIMTNGYRCQTIKGTEPYRGPQCVSSGHYGHAPCPGRDYPVTPFIPRDTNSYLCHRRGSVTPGWSESSQPGNPEREDSISSMDSGLGDSRSLTPVDMSMSSHAATILPVHVYPLPQQIRVAFSAARTSNFAPGSLDHPIVFDLLLNNLGDTFDFQVGRFMCPVNGTYVFIFHMLKLAVNVPLYVNLMKNDEVMVSAYANDGAPDHETASNHAVLQLFQGDQIWLRLHRGAIYGSSWKYSTFSGYLLYQD